MLGQRRREGIEAILGTTFRDREMLRRALTHRSYAHESSMGPYETNERLEFVGDAVLDLVLSDYLYTYYGRMDEGDLTRIRSYLVNMNSLAETARELGIGPHILLSREERADGGEGKSSILADTLEALIGAAYLDLGLKKARRMVLRIFRDKLEEAVSGPLNFDYKSQLQEMLVKEKGKLPKYRLREEGPDHRKVFHAAVYLEQQKLGQGKGNSTKEAEQEAARDALRRRAPAGGTGSEESGRKGN